MQVVQPHRPLAYLIEYAVNYFLVFRTCFSYLSERCSSAAAATRKADNAKAFLATGGRRCGDLALRSAHATRRADGMGAPNLPSSKFPVLRELHDVNFWTQGIGADARTVQSTAEPLLPSPDSNSDANPSR